MPDNVKEIDLSKNLTKLSEIANWFDEQEEIDVEGGLKKVKEAYELIKESKGRLGEIENEFEIIKRDIEGEMEVNEKPDKNSINTSEKINKDQGINPADIPF